MGWTLLDTGWWYRHPTRDGDDYEDDLVDSHNYWDGCDTDRLDEFTEDGETWYECQVCGMCL